MDRREKLAELLTRRPQSGAGGTLSEEQKQRLARLIAEQPSPARAALDWRSDPRREEPFVPLGERFREGISSGLSAPFGNERLGLLPERVAKPVAGGMAFLSELNPYLALTEGGYDLANSLDPEYMFETARAALGFIPNFQKVIGLEKLMEQYGTPGDVGPHVDAAAARAAAHDAAVMALINPQDIGHSGVEVHHNIKHAIPKPEIKPGVDPEGTMITAAYDPSMAAPEGEKEAGEPVAGEVRTTAKGARLARKGPRVTRSRQFAIR
jgi:hypothetical protein